MFARARKLIRIGNETSIYFKHVECNKTSNLNAKYHSDQNIHVQHYGSGRGPAFSKTLRFGITLLAGRSLLYDVEPAVNRQPGFRRELVEQSTTFTSSFLKCPPSGTIGIGESKSVNISEKRGTGSKPMFARARKLILCENETSI